MNRVKINDPSSVEDAVKILKNGGIVMHPTETCYGLAVDIFSKDALRRLYEVKGMSADKPLGILVDGFGMANDYGLFSEKAVGLVRKYWPGPLSIVVPRKRNLPDHFNPGNDFVSIRVSSLGFCTEMVSELGRPVTTTSANRTGEQPFYLPEKLLGVDLLVDGGEISKNKPSTIVMVEGDKIEVLRRGDILCE